MAVEFGLLGSIEARIDGRVVDLGPARRRLVLAALLVDVNQPVTVDQLLERAWTDAPAHSSVYSHLSRLRGALAAAGGVAIVRRDGGYVLATEAHAVDLHRFRHLVAQARQAEHDDQAAARFGQALRLWRGSALATADTPWASKVRAGLDQERLGAELDHGDVRLRLGQHGELLPVVETLALEHPLDERLAGQVMLALYRCGRTARALGHYQHARHLLAEELGISPGPELQRLHQQILTADPALCLGGEAGPVTGAATAGARSAPLPRQLPAPPALFTGRVRELARLSAALEREGEAGSRGTVVISAIGGTGGIGKTYLALHWAHTHADRFPDGQLYVNLRGFDPAGEPVSPPAALRGFLGALGVEAAAIPADLGAQAGLYRSLIAGKRMLIVLDNARDTAQVAPLLPGSPTCTVLVTSRHQLIHLVATHGAQPLGLDTLTEDEARHLIARHLGHERLAAEPEAVAALLRHCAGLPLALSIIAARAATHPRLSLAALADELRETSTRLDALDTGELTANLRAIFDASYHTLGPEAAQALALLGLAPGPDISLSAAASLIASPQSGTRALLRRLEAAHLIHQHTPGRYRMHDLVRLYAAEHGHHTLDDRSRTPALRRLIDFYLHTADHADDLVHPHPLMLIELTPPAPGCTPHPLPSQTAALDWFTAEYPCLLAAQRLAVDYGWHTPAWQLPCKLDNFQYLQGRLPERIPMWRAGLAAAQHLTDPTPHAHTHACLGDACCAGGQHAEGRDHLSRALALFKQTGDLHGQAQVHARFVFCAQAKHARSRDEGSPRRALPHAERARQLYRRLGNTAWEAAMLNAAGWCHARCGEFQQARAHCEQARTLPRAAVMLHTEVNALDNLGYIASRTGQHTQALDYYHQALTLARGIGYTHTEAEALERLGDTHRALGQIPEARHAWHHALDLYRSQHRSTEAERLQAHLEALDESPR